MPWQDRKGSTVPSDDGQETFLARLYGTRLGRAVVKLLIRPGVSRMAGALMDSRLSRIAIRSFIRRNRIDMSDYVERKYRSFNDFFTREIKPEKRPVDRDPAHLIAPCDSKLSVCPITADARFTVKHTEYTMESLLRDGELAKRYEGGVFLLFRLTVGDYHRYCYVDHGQKQQDHRIPGVFYTVNPIANDRYPIYKENTRVYSLLESEQFGTVLMMEVGATMVGRIVNDHPGAAAVRRGQEKGRFEFGGSTVILCLERDRAVIDRDLLQNTARGVETVVKMGERIGERIEK